MNGLNYNNTAGIHRTAIEIAYNTVTDRYVLRIVNSLSEYGHLIPQSDYKALKEFANKLICTTAPH